MPSSPYRRVNSDAAAADTTGVANEFGEDGGQPGVDPTDPAFGESAASRQYVATVYELYGNGLLAQEFAERARAALTDPTSTTEDKEASR